MINKVIIIIAAWAFTAANAYFTGTQCTVYNSTALAGTILFNTSVPTVGFNFTGHRQKSPSSFNFTSSFGPYSAIWQGNIHLTPNEYLFGIDTGGVGYAKLWVDDRLLVDIQQSGQNSSPHSHFPVANGAYEAWLGANIDTPGHSLASDGGDCPGSKCGSLEACTKHCDSLASAGCIGFVTEIDDMARSWCYMRKLAKDELNCSQAIIQSNRYMVVTKNATCSFSPGWEPGSNPSPPSPKETTVYAKFSVPVPFLPDRNSSRFRIEFTVGTGVIPRKLVFLVNGSQVTTDTITSTILPAEQQYFSERAKAEKGWNTWLSNDLLTHALLPHGLAVKISFNSAGVSGLSNLGGRGPSCDRSKFPVTLGLHTTRGQYTELAAIDYNGGRFRVESSTDNATGDLNLQITTLLPAKSIVNVTFIVYVPSSWLPRECLVIAFHSLGRIKADCPGFSPIFLQMSDLEDVAIKDNAFVVPAITTVNESISLYTYIGTDPGISKKKISSQIKDARSKLVRKLTEYGEKNETFSGMVAAIAWNVIYTPYEGIFTPVFRGSPWSVSKPHNYVLFEWDTYLSAIIAVYIDQWVAKSNIIRMTKSMIKYGYVAGFWNGLCGEVDKSKPPVGALALSYLISYDIGNLWVVELLIDQHVLWNRWWNRRMHSNMVAPGSSREMINTPINCNTEDPVGASRCETGLDNSPLYDGSKFIFEVDTLDSVDVGMTALLALDTEILSNLSRLVGKPNVSTELIARSTMLSQGLMSMWNDEEGVFQNRMWQNSSWAPLVVAPTNFYPMLVNVPSDIQVLKMMNRWLTNASEFALLNTSSYGIPSVSRSNPNFKDNNYWRGRSWGPMNFLVYLGLKNYRHLLEVQSAIEIIAAQSESTFLIEWVTNHRIMENYNSVTGVGCDVKNSIPFYHWGALMALIPLLEAGLLEI